MTKQGATCFQLMNLGKQKKSVVSKSHLLKNMWFSNQFNRCKRRKGIHLLVFLN